MRYRIDQYFHSYNQWVSFQQDLWFDSHAEAEGFLDEHLLELGDSHRADYRVVPDPNAPQFDLGYQFKLPNLPSPGPSQGILTYRYHNGRCWRYHVGLILGKAGDTPPPPYQNCSHWVFMDYLGVDYCTADEAEIPT